MTESETNEVYREKCAWVERMSDYLDAPTVQELLAAAIGHPTSGKLKSICSEYRYDSNRRLFGLYHENSLVGIIGLRQEQADSIEIHHIAATPTQQHRGIGRQMVREVQSSPGLRQVIVETDSDAVNFYRRCGFLVQSLGEQYPGVERFRCEWFRK